MKGELILSHGRESGPNATKITRLDAIATELGWRTQRPDYGTEAEAPERIAKLLALAQATSGRLMLAGSSMGAYISAAVSLQLEVEALFLLAPPVFFRNQEPALRVRCKHICIVHGWRDELIDPSEVTAFARANRAKLILVDDDHRLKSSMPDIESAFRLFMAEPVAIAPPVSIAVQRDSLELL